jgi:hypothetical protein
MICSDFFYVSFKLTVHSTTVTKCILNTIEMQLMGNKENVGEDIHQFDMVCSELDIICPCYYSLGIDVV